MASQQQGIAYSFQLLQKILQTISPPKNYFTNLYLILIIVAIIQLPAPYLFKAIIDNVLPNQNIPLLFIVIFGLFFVELLKAIFTVINTYLLSKFSQNLSAKLRKKLFRHYLEIPYQNYLETPTGKSINHLINDTESTASFIQHLLWVVPLPLVMVFMGSSVLLFWNWKIGLYVLISIPITLLLTKRLSHKLKQIRSDYRDAQENLQGKTNEAIDNIRIIRSFHREKEFDKELSDEIESFKEISISHFLHSSMLRSSNRIIETASSYLFIIFGAYLTITNEISLGEFFAFKYFQEMIAPNLNHLYNYLTEMPNQTVSVERVFQSFSVPIEAGRKNKVNDSLQLSGDITFKDVHLYYPDGTHSLKGLNFQVKSGETIAIIGPSGSGKTSLVSLLLGLYPCSEGSILIDEQRLADFNILQFRKNIGVIFQDAQLFDASIKENLLLGIDRIVTDEELWQALRLADATQFVKETKDQLGTIIGNRGLKLSGGQRQRLTIARMLLKNPKILILDEATSALDSISEKEIQNQMKTAIAGRTTFIIAHRLSTISIADKIIVMQDGHIKEMGTHKNLIEKNGLYKKLVQSQMDGFLKWENLS